MSLRALIRRGLLMAIVISLSATFACANPPPPPDPPPAIIDRDAFTERTGWYGLYLSDKKIGWTRTGLSRKGAASDQYRLETESFMRFNTGGIIQESEMSLTIDFDDELTAKAFDFSMASPAMTMTVAGIVDGGVLRTTMTTPHGTRSEETEIPKGVDLFGLAEFRRSVEGYHVGDVIEGTAYEPQFLGMINYRIEVYDSDVIRTGATEEIVYKVKSTLGPIEQYSIVASNGDLIQSAGPMGIALKRESKAVAMDLGSSANLTDLYLELSIPVDTVIANPRAVRRAVMKVKGEGLAQISSGGAQSVVSEEGTGAAIVTVDLSAAPMAIEKGDSLLAFVKPSSFIQSGDSRVVSAASKVIRGAGTDAEKVSRIFDWVFRGIKKEPTFTIPSTVDVLASMTGDCNEHAALFAGLARASRIPTRIAAGVVYYNGRFAYHAWNEVLLDGVWVPIDPTLNEHPAGALRIRFATGDLDEQVKIASLAGKISIEILEIGL